VDHAYFRDDNILKWNIANVLITSEIMCDNVSAKTRDGAEGKLDSPPRRVIFENRIGSQIDYRFANLFSRLGGTNSWIDV
jgi:hypothetical protein